MGVGGIATSWSKPGSPVCARPAATQKIASTTRARLDRESLEVISILLAGEPGLAETPTLAPYMKFRPLRIGPGWRGRYGCTRDQRTKLPVSKPSLKSSLAADHTRGSSPVAPSSAKK